MHQNVQSLIAQNPSTHHSFVKLLCGSRWGDVASVRHQQAPHEALK